MGSGNLNEKRRRAEHATSALSKPFKSPLRRPLQTPAVKEEKEEEEASPTIKEQNSSSAPTLPEEKAHPATEAHPEATIPSLPSINSPSSNISSLPLSSHNRKRKTPISSSSGGGLTPSKRPILLDPETTALQKEQRALQSRLSALRSELDTAQQALRVESSDKDTELETLIAKWKGVSQSAAEEVFAGAEERVARLGGMKVWREQMRSQSARWEEEEMSSWYGSAEAEGFGNVDAEEVKARRAEMLRERDCAAGPDGKRDGDGDGKKRDEGVEEEEFTMEFMLKTLNIDLKLIGYDKEGQRWVKD